MLGGIASLNNDSLHVGELTASTLSAKSSILGSKEAQTLISFLPENLVLEVTVSFF